MAVKGLCFLVKSSIKSANKSYIAAVVRSISLLTAALRLASSTTGKCSFRRLIWLTTAADTTSRVNHLLSAGTTYQGAYSVAVLRIISSYAAM